MQKKVSVFSVVLFCKGHYQIIGNVLTWTGGVMGVSWFFGKPVEWMGCYYDYINTITSLKNSQGVALNWFSSVKICCCRTSHMRHSMFALMVMFASKHTCTRTLITRSNTQNQTFTLMSLTLSKLKYKHDSWILCAILHYGYEIGCTMPYP